MSKLADIAKSEAKKFFHGYVMQTESNLDEIIEPFPKWTKEEADGVWCAAFVYYCCSKAGYVFSIKPYESLSCNLAGCVAWEEWALCDARINYYKEDGNYIPLPGDIVIYDYVFDNSEHDHMGIVVETEKEFLVVAEGNINNVSGVIRRKRDEHIRCYIRFPEGLQNKG